MMWIVPIVLDTAHELVIVVENKTEQVFSTRKYKIGCYSCSLVPPLCHKTMIDVAAVLVVAFRPTLVGDAQRRVLDGVSVASTLRVDKVPPWALNVDDSLPLPPVLLHFLPYFSAWLPLPNRLPDPPFRLLLLHFPPIC